MIYNKEQTRKKLHDIIDSIIDNREDVNTEKIPTWKVVSPTPAMIYSALYRLGLTDSEMGLIRVNYDNQKGLSADIKDIFRMLSE